MPPTRLNLEDRFRSACTEQVPVFGGTAKQVEDTTSARRAEDLAIAGRLLKKADDLFLASLSCW